MCVHDRQPSHTWLSSTPKHKKCARPGWNHKWPPSRWFNPACPGKTVSVSPAPPTPNLPLSEVYLFVVKKCGLLCACCLCVDWACLIVNILCCSGLALCCSMLEYAAVCCNMLECVALCCSIRDYVVGRCSVWLPYKNCPFLELKYWKNLLETFFLGSKIDVCLLNLFWRYLWISLDCNTLQYVATHCNTL